MMTQGTQWRQRSSLAIADQKIASDAYKARVAEIKAQQEAEAAAMAEPGPETQTVAEWQQEFMGGASHE
ncbi:MAG: hypothetical protein IPN19_15295 [Elusimicrobia bacterium]|nr:hypothetical protein [Elusimicrobiota bacterium]